MRIENNYTTTNFGSAYLDMRSLNRYGYGKKTIIKALKNIILSAKNCRFYK